MAAAALLRSVARKMSRAAAPTHHHHPSLVARGLHGSGPANSNQIKQGTAVSPGMAAATGLRSVSGRLMTKISHAPPPSHRRLVHGRGIHSRTSPDPIPSTLKKVLDSTTFDKAASGMACIVLASAAIYTHFWLKPKVEKITAYVKKMEATIMDLKAENAQLKLKIALDSARPSQGN